MAAWRGKQGANPRRRLAATDAFRHPLLVLAAAAILNAAVYLLIFVRPWNLLVLYSRPLLDLRYVSAGAPLARWWLLTGFVLLGFLYWLGWRAALRARGRAAWGLVLAGAAISGAILLFLYPFDAADIFDNIIHGRILGLYGANPFDQVVADFQGDPFYPYAAWRHFPSAYGPGWEFIAAVTARLAGDGIVANVLAFKALGGLYLAGCVALVAALLGRSTPERSARGALGLGPPEEYSGPPGRDSRPPGRALAGTLLLAWNPLILYETLGHGHNDVIMLFWILLAVWCLAQGRYTFSVLTLVAGALVKFIPLLFLPAAGLISLRSIPTTGARLRFVAVTACAAVALVVLSYAPFWHGPETLGIGHRLGLLTASLPATAVALLQVPLGHEWAARSVSLVAAGLTALFALWQGVRASRYPSWQAFARAAFNISIFYLLLTCLWFQQWYAVWPLGLVPLLPAGHLAWLGLSFGFAVLSKPLIFEPIWLWPHPAPDRSWLELRLGPSVLALPWLLTLAALWHGWRARAASRRTSSQAEGMER